MTYLYAGLGIVMLTGIMAIVQMSVAMVGQQSAEPVKPDATAQSYLPVEKTILQALARGSQSRSLTSCAAVTTEISNLNIALRTQGCNNNVAIYSSQNGDYRLAVQWIDPNSIPELWSCGKSTANRTQDKSCDLALFTQS